jgi:integrase
MSVRKRSWTTSKGEAKEAWIVDYVDQKGKRHIETFKRKKDADEAAAKTKVAVGEGTHTAKSDSITVEKAGKLWIATCQRDGLERTTIDHYQQHLKFHILPELGRLKLAQLSAPMIREFEDKLRLGTVPPVEKVEGPRSAAMTKKIRGSLSTLLADAMERGLINRNVVRDLRSRRKKGKERRAEKRQKGKLEKGIDYPTPDEIRAIMGALKGRWRPLLLTAIYTGLRASELRGLRWADIDIERKKLHVRQRADAYKVIGAPKSEAGARTVPFGKYLANTLREWKLQCPKSELDLVFPTGTGAVEYHANVVNRGLKPAQIKAGVTVDGKAKYTGVHALRHFYASWCINPPDRGGLGLPPKVVQARLGHSSIQMTLDVYGHLFPDGDDSEKLDAAELSLIDATCSRHGNASH